MGVPYIVGPAWLDMLASPQDQSEAQILLRALQDVNVGTPQWKVGSSSLYKLVQLKSSGLISWTTKNQEGGLCFRFWWLM